MATPTSSETSAVAAADKVVISRQVWDRFNDAVDEIGWTDLGDPARFGMSIHRGFQALREVLRDAALAVDTPSSDDDV